MRSFNITAWGLGVSKDVLHVIVQHPFVGTCELDEMGCAADDKLIDLAQGKEFLGFLG